MAVAAVTPAGVRDGDPEALAGLCERRGPAVLAYCQLVAAEGNASGAAAEAFGRFRAVVAEADDLGSLNPEALLLSATRHAAAQRAPRPAEAPKVLRRIARRQAPGSCEVVPLLLAARAEHIISEADRHRLERHLAGCEDCRAASARFEAAERAYRDPPESPVPAAVASTIVAALTAAAPVRAAEGEPAAARAAAERRFAEDVGAVPATNGSTHPPADDVAIPAAGAAEAETAGPAEAPALHEPAAAAPDAPPAEEPSAVDEAVADAPGGLDQPTTEFGLLPEEEDEPGADSRPFGSHEPTAGPPPFPADEPDTERRTVVLPSQQGIEPAPVAVTPPPVRRRGPGGVPLPRPPRPIRPAPAGPVPRAERTPRRAVVVLPLVLVVLAVGVALGVAGVFGGGDAAPATDTQPGGGSLVPADDGPSDTVVAPPAPGTPAAVERAKARERARRAADDDRPSTAPATPGPDDASSDTGDGALSTDSAPTPAPVTPAPAQTPPADSPTGDGSPQAEEDPGTHGSEQLPPKQDSSAVPELAPPAQPASPTP